MMMACLKPKYRLKGKPLALCQRGHYLFFMLFSRPLKKKKRQRKEKEKLNIFPAS